ncbi:hypothetical protein HRbin36_02700 [bacterium HR36]|nr:hypothetical protein HRbin36_02700 [bacterium HR36]
MGADLKLFAGLLVNMGAAQDGVALNARGQRNRPMHSRSRHLRSFHDAFSGLIQDGVIISFHPNTNPLSGKCGHDSDSLLDRPDLAHYGRRTPAALLACDARQRERHNLQTAVLPSSGLSANIAAQAYFACDK